MAEHADAIIIGGGFAGLVAAAELADAGKRVIILEQEGGNSLGTSQIRVEGVQPFSKAAA